MDKSLRWYHWAIVAVLVLRVATAGGGGPFEILGAAAGATAVVWALTMTVRIVRINRGKDAEAAN